MDRVHSERRVLVNYKSSGWGLRGIVAFKWCESLKKKKERERGGKKEPHLVV